MDEAKERDYKAEYKKFQSSTKSKKYRAELNQYNRKKGTYGNGDGKDASHKGGKIVGFESQSKNRGRAEKSRLKKEVKLNENPAAMAAVTAMTKIKMKNPTTGKENSAVSALKDKDNPNHKKAKGIFAKLKDRFSKKKDDKKAAPKKQSQADADFYKRLYTGESVNEAENKIADIRMILKTKKGKRIDSIFMDVETAEEVMKHYKSLGRGAKERFTKQKIQNMVKAVKKESVNEAANKIKDIRMILKTKKGKRIDSIFMDVETAEDVMKHYKSLSGSAKEKFAKQKIQNLVKSVKKANESVNEANKMSTSYKMNSRDKHDVEKMWFTLVKDKRKKPGDIKDYISKKLKINYFEVSSYIDKNILKESVNEAYGDLNDDGFKKIQNTSKHIGPIDKKLKSSIRKKDAKETIRLIRKLNDIVGIMDNTYGSGRYYESVNEGQKRDSHKAYMKYYKAYEVFARETMELAKTTSKLSGEKTDEKIIIKNFKKYVIPFAGLMNSWDKGQQQNPGLKESDLGLTYKKGKTVKVTHKKSGKELVIVDKPNVRKEYEKRGFFAESVNEANNIDKIKDIVKRKQYKKIDGIMVDMQTANVIMRVWKALGSSNRSKFEKLPIKKMANVAWKLMK